MKLDITDAKTQKLLISLSDVSNEQTVGSVKREIHEKIRHLDPSRQLLRLEPRGKPLRDEETIGELKLPVVGAQLYIRDLGFQLAWKTVFLCEYFGPFAIYPIFYARPSLIYGEKGSREPIAAIVHVALFCWLLHYGKRLFETLFVHRFSHATMPVRNLFKNCGYYWSFAAYVAYYVNHPLFTPPSYGALQATIGFVGFIIGELGNYSIHTALRDLRPAGTKERNIPMPNGNPFTNLFTLVSCPNYTYEFVAWFSFAIMTQCLPALLFAIVGLYQMTVWAIGKHKAYKREFPTYPKVRRAIIPYVL